METTRTVRDMTCCFQSSSTWTVVICKTKRSHRWSIFIVIHLYRTSFNGIKIPCKDLRFVFLRFSDAPLRYVRRNYVGVGCWWPIVIYLLKINAENRGSHVRKGHKARKVQVGYFRHTPFISSFGSLNCHLPWISRQTIAIEHFTKNGSKADFRWRISSGI